MPQQVTIIQISLDQLFRTFLCSLCIDRIFGAIVAVVFCYVKSVFGNEYILISSFISRMVEKLVKLDVLLQDIEDLVSFWLFL